jgi:long-chain acyl-CoA synthetase
MSIIQQFYKHVLRTPDKVAVIFDDELVSYQELARQISSLSKGLIDAGVKKGDHVAVLLPNGVEFVVLMIAAANIGVVLVPNNMTIGELALLRSMQAADVKHAIVWHALIPDLINTFDQMLDEGALLVSVGGENDGAISFDALLLVSSDISNLMRTDELQDHPYILTMTSGSTGEPKPIILSQHTKELRAKAAIELYQVTHEDIVLIATPMYHSLAERLAIIPLITGGTCVLLGMYTAKKWLHAVITHQVTFAIPVSSQLKQILIELNAHPCSLASLRCLVSSSERLPDSVREEMKQLIHCEFHECYGASEVAIVTNLDHQKNSGGSVGHAIRGVDIKILDDKKELLGVNLPGEIVCKTPMLFSGYYKKPEQTDDSMWGEYFCTGDIGCLDEDGYLYFLGRKKDIIITGGINIYPKDIEDVLNSHESVIECAVIPLPDDVLGEKLTAVVVAENNMPLNIRDLQRLCFRFLADYQQPRSFIVLDVLPKSPMGKIMKQTLIQQLAVSPVISANDKDNE